MPTQIWVNIFVGNGLLLDITKPLSERMLTYQQKMFPGIYLSAISQEVLMACIQWLHFKNTIYQGPKSKLISTWHHFNFDPTRPAKNYGMHK